ncbi:MAG: regulatory protein RecX [Ruminococcaceae bacterium]|nr:regulatory protein RecX [Oscillospiraceae bacterium]
MIIVKTIISKGGSEVTLECEFREKHTLTRADAIRLGLYDLSEDDFPVEFADDELIEFLAKKLKAIKYATYLLQFSDKSEKVLRRKMQEKDYSNEVIDEALSVMRSSGIISDENLCLKKYVSIANSKLYGPHRIKNELFSKGFSSEDIKNAENLADIDFYELCKELCNKLLSSSRINLSDRQERDKFKAKLSRYGYGFDEINSALENLDYSVDDETDF